MNELSFLTGKDVMGILNMQIQELENFAEYHAERYDADMKKRRFSGAEYHKRQVIEMEHKLQVLDVLKQHLFAYNDEMAQKRIRDEIIREKQE